MSFDSKQVERRRKSLESSSTKKAVPTSRLIQPVKKKVTPEAQEKMKERSEDESPRLRLVPVG